MNAPIAIDMDQATADLKELRELAALQNFDLFGLIRELSDAGASGVEVDSLSAVSTRDGVVRYKLADRLLVCLATLRAGQVHPHKIEGTSCDVRRHNGYASFGHRWKSRSSRRIMSG
jgi:hypothetical protein